MVIVSTYCVFGSGFSTHVNFYSGNSERQFFWDDYFGQLHTEWNVIP